VGGFRKPLIAVIDAGQVIRTHGDLCQRNELRLGLRLR
jgi:hypothetical protein